MERSHLLVKLPVRAAYFFFTTTDFAIWSKDVAISWPLRGLHACNNCVRGCHEVYFSLCLRENRLAWLLRDGLTCVCDLHPNLSGTQVSTTIYLVTFTGSTWLLRGVAVSRRLPRTLRKTTFR